jgi:hypothetical protein
MQNLTLITSIIHTPDTPLSYTKCRSVFTSEQRFEQTKRTIASVREKIPNNKIFLIECSLLSQVERAYFLENTDYFLNLHDSNNEILIQRMFTISKSMGEGTMTIHAILYLLENNIEFDQFFKISGRYWLNDLFDYSLYDHPLSAARRIQNDPNNILCCFYKLSKNKMIEWLDFLLHSENDFRNCIGYEVLFAKFLLKYSDVFTIQEKVGIHGYISVCGTLLDA